MRFAIVDDQLIEAKLLAKHLSRGAEELGLSNPVFSHYLNGHDFLTALKSGEHYDTIFLDIYMDGMNGVEVARAVRASGSDVTIVFCTSSNEYAMESYEVGACFYLLKPFTHDNILQMLKRVAPAVKKAIQTITLQDGLIVIPRDIISTEHYNHKITLHMNAGDDLTTRINQAELEEHLSAFNSFCTVNRGYIVNFQYVEELNDNGFLMTDGSIIPISRGRKPAVLQQYEDYKRRLVEDSIIG